MSTTTTTDNNTTNQRDLPSWLTNKYRYKRFWIVLIGFIGTGIALSISGLGGAGQLVLDGNAGWMCVLDATNDQIDEFTGAYNLGAPVDCSVDNWDNSFWLGFLSIFGFAALLYGMNTLQNKYIKGRTLLTEYLINGTMFIIGGFAFGWIIYESGISAGGVSEAIIRGFICAVAVGIFALLILRYPEDVE